MIKVMIMIDKSILLLLVSCIVLKKFRKTYYAMVDSPSFVISTIKFALSNYFLKSRIPKLTVNLCIYLFALYKIDNFSGVQKFFQNIQSFSLKKIWNISVHIHWISLGYSHLFSEIVYRIFYAVPFDRVFLKKSS